MSAKLIVTSDGDSIFIRVGGKEHTPGIIIQKTRIMPASLLLTCGEPITPQEFMEWLRIRDISLEYILGIL